MCRWTDGLVFRESFESDGEQWRLWPGPSAAVKGRAGKRRWPRARLTCRASPRPMQVPAPCRPISAPGRQQVCPPGSHRPGGRQRRDAAAGRAAGPRTHSCPPPSPSSPACPPAGAQLEQKPGRRASAGAAVKCAGSWEAQGSSYCPGPWAPPCRRVRGGEASEVTRHTLCSAPGVALATAASPINRGPSLDLPLSALGPRPQAVAATAGSPLPESLTIPPLGAPSNNPRAGGHGTGWAWVT